MTATHWLLWSRRLPRWQKTAFVAVYFIGAIAIDVYALLSPDAHERHLSMIGAILFSGAAWTLGGPFGWLIAPIPLLFDIAAHIAVGGTLGNLLQDDLDLVILDILLVPAMVLISDGLQRTTLQRDEIAVSERRFHRLGDHADIGIWIADRELTKFLYVSPALMTIYGVARDDILTPASRLRYVHPDDLLRLHDNMRQAREGGSSTFEYRVVRPSGEIRWVRAHHFAILDEEGRVIEIGGTTEDVTDARRAAEAVARSEERFRRLGDASRESFWIVSADTRTYHYLSPAIERITGRPRSDLLRDPSAWVQWIHPDDRPLTAALSAKLLAGEGYDAEYRIVRPDGEVRWVHDRSYVIRSASGATELAGIVEDITDARKSAEALRRSETLSTVGGLVAGVAHEINNPLMYVRLNTELVADDLAQALQGALPDATREILQDARSRIDTLDKGLARVEEVTGGLKRVARATTAPRRREPLNELVQGIMAIAAARISPNVEMRATLDAPADATVDGPRVSQALLNLVINAGDALGDHAGHIWIRTSVKDGRAIIDVRDDGPGIPPEVQARLFQPFFTTKPQGTGLGLSVSRELLVEVNGTLELVRPEGRGATFRIELPIPPALAREDQVPG